MYRSEDGLTESQKRKFIVRRPFQRLSSFHDENTTVQCHFFITECKSCKRFVLLFQGHQEFSTETIEFLLSKNQTKWPIELWTLKQEMETDDYHATMISFSLVQNIKIALKYFLLISRKIR